MGHRDAMALFRSGTHFHSIPANHLFHSRPVEPILPRMLLTTSLAIAAATFLSASPTKASKKKAPPAPKPDSALVAPAPEPDSLFGKVKVGPSQTASWIAFRQLGAWTPEIAIRVKADNPDIQDLNQLTAGQILRLRRSLDQRQLTPAQQISKAIRKAVVTYVKGEGKILRNGEAPSPLRANEFLSPGDKITTNTGAVVELVIDNQSVLRLRDKTVLALAAIQDSSNNSKTGTSVALEIGSIWTKVRKWAGPLVGFQVKMPNGVAGVHGTTFECFVANDSSGFVKVHEGLVGVSGRLQTMETPVPAGKSVLVKKDGLITTPVSIKDESAPDWNQFNEQRDQTMEELASAQLEAVHSLRENAMSEEATAAQTTVWKQRPTRP